MLLAAGRRGRRRRRWRRRWRGRRLAVTAAVVCPFGIPVQGECLLDAVEFSLFEFLTRRDEGSATSECMYG